MYHNTHIHTYVYIHTTSNMGLVVRDGVREDSPGSLGGRLLLARLITILISFSTIMITIIITTATITITIILSQRITRTPSKYIHCHHPVQKRVWDNMLMTPRPKVL